MIRFCDKSYRYKICCYFSIYLDHTIMTFIFENEMKLGPFQKYLLFFSLDKHNPANCIKGLQNQNRCVQ